MKKIPHLAQKLLYLGIFAAVILAARCLKLPCVYIYFLDTPCPGCGMTRACMAALRLDIAGAFSYHWMFWSVPVLLVYYFLDGRVFKNKILNAGLLWFIGFGFLANWIYTLFFR